MVTALNVANTILKRGFSGNFKCSKKSRTTLLLLQYIIQFGCVLCRGYTYHTHQSNHSLFYIYVTLP